MGDFNPASTTGGQVPTPPPPPPPVGDLASASKALTGGSSGYYKVQIKNPTTEFKSPYEAECNDIIEALQMNFAEGNAFKAIWRKAAARLGNGKSGTTALYDAEKVEFFGKRLVTQEKANGS